MTAATVARDEVLGRGSANITKMNVKKVTAFRQDGAAEFRALVEEIKERERASILARDDRQQAVCDRSYKFHIDTPKVRRRRRVDAAEGMSDLD
jgi:hypothetical protein